MDGLDGHAKTSGQDERLEFVTLKLGGLADTSDGMEKENGGEYSSRAEKSRISRKLDVRIILPLGLMLAASMFDRANIGNAAIAGMNEDLDLNTGSRYSLLLLIFFAHYVLFQLPIAVIMRKVGPRWFLPIITVIWGVVMMCFGFVQDWKIMIALRILLGILETGLFPGCVFLISTWYTRYEMQKQYSIFYFLTLLGIAFSGILAYIFSLMKGLAHYNAWRWIFIMEGILTCVIGFIGLALLVDMPPNAHKASKFLTEREVAFVMQSLHEDRHDGDEHEPFHLIKFLKPALDLKMWAFGFMYLFETVKAYAIGFFQPIVLQQQLQFPTVQVQLLTVPPYIYAGLLMYAQGWIADRLHIRSPIFVLNGLQGILGLCLLAWGPNPGSKYLGIFFVAGGSQGNLMPIITWQANNIRGQWKQSFASANIIGMGGIGGVVGSLVFRSQDAPQYLPGIYACIVCSCLTLVITCISTVYFYGANKRVADGIKVIEGLPGFRYTL